MTIYVRDTARSALLLLSQSKDSIDWTWNDSIVIRWESSHDQSVCCQNFCCFNSSLRDCRRSKSHVLILKSVCASKPTSKCHDTINIFNMWHRLMTMQSVLCCCEWTVGANGPPYFRLLLKKSTECSTSETIVYMWSEFMSLEYEIRCQLNRDRVGVHKWQRCSSTCVLLVLLVQHKVHGLYLQGHCVMRITSTMSLQQSSSPTDYAERVIAQWASRAQRPFQQSLSPT